MTVAVVDLPAYLGARRAEVEEALSRVLPPLAGDPGGLVAAMRYSVLAGGKRLRPVLCLAVFEACGSGGASGPPRCEVAEAASALELVHTYSLIHDDLPCMDDDSLRRGKPTCHVVHGEALALLAGDTLQSLGFEVLATRPAGPEAAGTRADAVAAVARAIGVVGMAGGQALDLAATGHAAGDSASPGRAAARLREIHELKTGKLLSAAAELGSILAGAPAPGRVAAARFGEALGLVFQIADDLLDVTATAEVLGKTAGKDAAQEKLTYPGVFGLRGAGEELETALAAALAAAREVEGGAGTLAALATYAARRDR